MKKQYFSTILHNLYRKALKHSKYRWVVILGTLFYLVSPVDIASDLIPVLGWIDDGIVVSLLVSEVSQLMGEQLKRKRQQNAQNSSYSNTVAMNTEVSDATDNVPTITVNAVAVG
jgi:uncharacterized membrane protein YkvA (DUF1232 family)